MQNQMQYPSNYSNGPSPLLASPKYNAQNYGKGFDKTLPTNPIKQYSSNPNLSLEMNYSRPSNQPIPEYPTYNNHAINKNLDFRTQGSGSNFPNSGSQVSTRPNRSEMTKSLIISDMEKH
jgi:hypothetical protein